MGQVFLYWVRKFKFGFSSIRDDVRSDPPADFNNRSLHISKALVFENRQITINAPVCKTKLSREIVGRILHDHMKMFKVCVS